MLTPERQRIKIAEKCGWINHGKGEFPFMGIGPCEDQNQGHYTEIPDYQVDLNACREMESVLDELQWLDYVLYLTEPIHSAKASFSGYVICATASARQRCEAFCRVFWPEV